VVRDLTPVGLWVSFRRMALLGEPVITVLAVVDSEGTVLEAPPVAAWAVGRRQTALQRWAKRHDPEARFAWIYPEGPGEIW
jgi:hypothetical protein